MNLEESHIQYLNMVKDLRVRLWWNTSKTVSKYVDSLWGESHQKIDQVVAAQMHAIGATHVGNNNRIELTDRGEKIMLNGAEMSL